ncbi:MAG: Signal recognition particle receptor FtsY [Cytophagales bacterium]|jgi:fused signal recognition particle receptor|nr:signal recognition particle-docking protein FtsY [Bacteroidota bacterium]MBS1980493.1 signal recognition particle-docking protein FtsY [Bacteroidota bacterium]WHZ07809.1 MAG: Signal recognition particle receptor FtsY [Cytophagales bacterium]
MSLLGKIFSKEKKESLDQGLQKSKENFFSKLGKALIGKSSVDDEVLDNLEEVLITSDVGVDTTLKIIKRIQDRVAKEKYLGTSELDRVLKEEVASLLSENINATENNFETPAHTKPYVIMVVGVNGVGKTTTIGKLSAQYKKHGKKVVLGAADTFRAAAVDQLKLWGERNSVPVVSKGMNTDPSAVAFETVQQGVELGADVIIIDTAGRLHTKVNLMQELSKIKRSIEKVLPGAPHDVLLVLDGSTGQNAIIQAREFTKATDVTCLAITKLDGTAKGGVVIGISDEFKIPVKYIGVGEKADDLQVFNKTEFVDSLFNKN